MTMSDSDDDLPPPPPETPTPPAAAESIVESTPTTPSAQPSPNKKKGALKALLASRRLQRAAAGAGAAPPVSASALAAAAALRQAARANSPPAPALAAIAAVAQANSPPPLPAAAAAASSLLAAGGGSYSYSVPVAFSDFNDAASEDGSVGRASPLPPAPPDEASSPQLLNLDPPDPGSVTEGSILQHILRKGLTRVGLPNTDPRQDMEVAGPLVEDEHCILEFSKGAVKLHPIGSCSINGLLLTESTAMRTGDVVKFGTHAVYRFILPAPPPPAAVAPAAPDAITHAANARTPIQTSAVRSLAPSAPAASAAVANKADIAARMEALKLKEAALQAKIDEAAKREQNSELLQEEATVTAATAQEVLSEAEQQAIAAEVQANLEAEKAIADKAKKAKWRAERKAAREAQRRGVSSLASKVADEISSEGSTTSLIGDAAHRKAQRAARVKSLGGIGALLADALDGAGGIDGEDIKSALAEVDPTTAEEEAAATKVPPTVPAKPSKEPPAVAAQPTDDGAAGVAVDPALAALKAEMEAMKAEMAKARADVDAERAARLLAEKHAEAVSATSPSAPTPQVKAPLGNIAEGSAILADATKRLRPTVAGSSSESSEKDKRRQSAELVGELAETLERRKSLPPQIMPKPRKPSMAGDAPEWANPRGDGEGEDGAVSSDSSQSLSPDNDDNGGDDASSSAGTDYEVVDEEDDLERDEEKAKETHGKFMDTFFNKNEDEERQAKEHEEAKAAAAAAAAAAEEAAAAAQKEEEAALAAEVNAAISHAPEGTGTYRSRALFAANPKKGQLGFSKGEYLYAIPTDRGWWAAVNVQGDEGKVPSNFLVEVHSMEVEDNATAAVEAATVEDEQEAAAAAALIAAGEQEAAAAAVEEAAAAADAAVAAAAAAAAEAAAAAAAAEAEANAANSADTPVGPEGTEPFTAKANFEPNKKKGQLGFRKGELLFAVQTSKGWWVAANEAGEEGKVPSNFLKPYVAPAASEPAPPKARPRSSIGSIAKSGGSRKEKALAWCRELVVGTDIAIDNFGSSWADGLAFCGIMAGLMPDKIDLTACAGNDRRENYTLAFWVALEAGQEPLLDVDDLMESPHPEPLACQTYIFELFRKFSAGGQLAHNVTGKLL